MIGWGVAQYPWMLVDEVTISAAAGADATLAGLLVVVGLAGVIVVPALAYLFDPERALDRVADRVSRLGPHDLDAVGAQVARRPRHLHPCP